MEISALQQKRGSYRNSAQAILEKALREGRALRPSEEVDYEGLAQKIRDIDRTFGYVEQFTARRDGDVFFKVVSALAAARGSMSEAKRIATTQGDFELDRALSASVATLGGFAVPTDYSDSIIEALRPRVSVRAMNPVVVTMKHGNFTWPKFSVGGSVSYMGESQSIPLSQTQSFATLQLIAKKLSAFVPVNNDFIRFANPTGDVIVREDLVSAVAAAEDYAFLNGDGTEFTPKGLLQWVPSGNQIAANGTVSLTNTDSDLSALESALTSANVRMLRPGWILNPTTVQYLKNLRGSDGVRAYPEISGGMLRGYPFAATTNMPSTNVLFADFADVVIGDAEFVIIGSDKGSYKDSTGTTVNAFIQDQSVIKIIAQHDIGVRHQESIAMLTGVTWAPAAS